MKKNVELVQLLLKQDYKLSSNISYEYIDNQFSILIGLLEPQFLNEQQLVDIHNDFQINEMQFKTKIGFILFGELLYVEQIIDRRLNEIKSLAMEIEEYECVKNINSFFLLEGVFGI